MTKSALPHSKVIQSNIADYLNEARELSEDALVAAKSASGFTSIYKITLAVDATLASLSDNLCPSTSALRSLIQKIPVQISLSQITAANFQLRQFIELSLKVIYFSQHQVEWKKHQEIYASAIPSDKDSPISFNANREPSFYRNYAKERFEKEPSGIAIKMAESLSPKYQELSKIVHAAEQALQASLSPSFEPATNKQLEKFAKIYADIGRACCILLVALDTHAFDQFPAATRAWFDWLVGADIKKQIRSGTFGLDDAF